MKSSYQFFISAIIPRPIALVSTVSEEGIVNVAPFSYFNIMCHDPPTVVFSISSKRSPNPKKDTLQNIEKNKECVINIISSWYLDQANLTSGEFPPDISELDEAKLSSIPSEIVSPPRIKESAVQFECKVKDFYPILKDNKVASTMAICNIELVHVKEDIYDKESGTILSEKLQPVSRLGGIKYATLGDIISIPRPKIS